MSADPTPPEASARDWIKADEPRLDISSDELILALSHEVDILRRSLAEEKERAEAATDSVLRLAAAIESAAKREAGIGPCSALMLIAKEAVAALRKEVK